MIGSAKGTLTFTFWCANKYSSQNGAIVAMTLLVMTPMGVVFVAFQKYVVRGLARSDIK